MAKFITGLMKGFLGIVVLFGGLFGTALLIEKLSLDSVLLNAIVFSVGLYIIWFSINLFGD